MVRQPCYNIVVIQIFKTSTNIPVTAVPITSVCGISLGKSRYSSKLVTSPFCISLIFFRLASSSALS